MLLGFALLAACAPDPGELPLACDPRELAPGEVRGRRIACDDELIPGGEGRLGDWLLENAEVRFVVRDTYASLTQLDEPGGTLVDAARVGGADLLMELVPAGERGSIELVATEGAAELRLPGLTWRLEADAARLELVPADGAPPSATWVPRPGVDHVGTTARWVGEFFAVDTLDEPSTPADDLGQVPVAGVTGVSLTAEAHWPDGDPLAAEVDANVVEVLVGRGVVDRVPVVGGVATSTTPAGASLRAARAGCTADGLTLLACGGLTVRVEDDLGRPLPATVRFGGADFPLPLGYGRAALGPTPGPVWVWAGPRYAAWNTTFHGGEEAIGVVLPRVLPAAEAWAAAAGPGHPADWPEGGLELADFAVEVAPDADTARTAEVAREAARAAGYGLVLYVADDEVPVVTADERDPTLTLTGSRTEGAWTWGWSPTTRRSGHGALDLEDPADLYTLVRGGAGADRFVITDAPAAAARLAESPVWAWPVRPDALWLDSPADLPVYEAFANAWVDVLPLASHTWLPYSGARNLAAVEHALFDSTATAGNGPVVELTDAGRVLFGRHEYAVQVRVPGWMGAPEVTLHTDLGTAPVRLDPNGAGRFTLQDARWAYVEVAAPRSTPWGGQAAWAVSPLVWARGPADPAP